MGLGSRSHCAPQILNGTIWDAFYIVGNSTDHDRQEQLRQISQNGQAFVAKYLCHRGRALYWQRVLHEYRGIFRCGSSESANQPLMSARTGRDETLEKRPEPGIATLASHRIGSAGVVFACAPEMDGDVVLAVSVAQERGGDVCIHSRSGEQSGIQRVVAAALQHVKLPAWEAEGRKRWGCSTSSTTAAATALGSEVMIRRNDTGVRAIRSEKDRRRAPAAPAWRWRRRLENIEDDSPPTTTMSSSK